MGSCLGATFEYVVGGFITPTAETTNKINMGMSRCGVWKLRPEVRRVVPQTLAGIVLTNSGSEEHLSHRHLLTRRSRIWRCLAFGYAATNRTGAIPAEFRRTPSGSGPNFPSPTRSTLMIPQSWPQTFPK